MIERPTLALMADQLAAGETTPTQLVERALVEAQKAPQVFISLLAERARRDAAESTYRRSKELTRGPYDGIPYAVKDLFDVAGSITTAASRTRLNAAPAEQDAGLVRSLADHGLIPIGKANLSEFAFSGLGLNPHFGTPVPARDPLRVPGGSSSGSAIAIERGIVAVALGTDTAGSMRVPAAFNGLAGFRPSQGRYDKSGIFPLAESFDVPGPMANTVDDVAILDALMRGGDPVPPSDMPPFILDIGVLEDPVVSAPVHDGMERLANWLEAQGVCVERRRLRLTSETRALIAGHGWLGGFEAARLHAAMLDGPDRALVDARVVRRLDAARAMSAVTADWLYRQRQDLMQLCVEELGGGILLTPTVVHAAPLLAPLEGDVDLFAAANLAALSLTMVGSFLDMPALAMPYGASGLLSVQLSAPRGQDDAVLAAGLRLEQLGLDFI